MHGSSTASWTAVLLALTGITIGGVALVPEPHWALFTIGCAVTLIAGPVGKILSVAGLGASDSH
jgi:hypothetical protein